MKCPNCDQTLLMADRQNVQIDYCPDCRGIWLDRGELEKIIENSAVHYSKKENYEREYGDQRPGGYSNDYYKQHPHKKRKSFLNDLFDF